MLNTTMIIAGVVAVGGIARARSSFGTAISAAPASLFRINGV